ncbi:hypothetical protein OUZ56_021678 [Daphnia magna]|uniref:Uncharacterized protein n=1 Tax=Daphnia magna TaxID=35525 RepID=A0ABR0AU63_9CRUS|nr:hypothetical protein OUZ56_021678 [Daphnia magna]
MCRSTDFSPDNVSNIFDVFFQWFTRMSIGVSNVERYLFPQSLVCTVELLLYLGSVDSSRFIANG